MKHLIEFWYKKEYLGASIVNSRTKKVNIKDIKTAKRRVKNAINLTSNNKAIDLIKLNNSTPFIRKTNF